MADEKIRLLLIDDDSDDFTLVKSYLSRAEGLPREIDWASNYSGGLTRLSEGGYDLCLVDYFLGAKTGVELISEARSLGLSTPFIMLTGVGDRKIDMAAIEAGAADYLNKEHLNPEIIERSIRHAITHFRDSEEIRKLSANLEAIFSSVTDPIITVDTELNIIELNRGAEEFCGLTRAGSIGKSFEQLVPGSELLLKAIRETISGKVKVESKRVEFPDRDGRERIVSFFSSPLRNPSGALTGAVLVIRDLTRLDRLERDLASRSEYHNIIGTSTGIQEVFSLIERVSGVDTTVLVTGESGTGKELVAEAIHHKGARAKGPLVKVNCTALSENLLESELFGHVKGAFTGAIRDRIGSFEAAGGGTIFLDEVGEMSSNMQVKLLRVLQEREVVPVGDTKPIKVDVRVLAATNRDLPALVRDGSFREDLYYRL
ncbi:MAG: sigma 54-interacting transcriptional regulator, partial [Thermodesulfobacteriota bacterium]